MPIIPSSPPPMVANVPAEIQLNTGVVNHESSLPTCDMTHFIDAGPETILQIVKGCTIIRLKSLIGELAYSTNGIVLTDQQLEEIVLNLGGDQIGFDPDAKDYFTTYETDTTPLGIFDSKYGTELKFKINAGDSSIYVWVNGAKVELGSKDNFLKTLLENDHYLLVDLNLASGITRQIQPVITPTAETQNTEEDPYTNPEFTNMFAELVPYLGLAGALLAATFFVFSKMKKPREIKINPPTAEMAKKIILDARTKYATRKAAVQLIKKLSKIDSDFIDPEIVLNLLLEVLPLTYPKNGPLSKHFKNSLPNIDLMNFEMRRRIKETLDIERPEIIFTSRMDIIKKLKSFLD